MGDKTQPENGTSWSAPTNVNLTSLTDLFSITATSPNDIWAAGRGGGNTLIWHSSDGGANWAQTTSENSSNSYSQFHGITVDKNSGALFAAGFYKSYQSGSWSPFKTLIEQYASSPTPKSITVKPTQGPPGTVVTVTGSGWTPGNVVDISLSSSVTILTKATVAGDGTFTTSFAVPENAATGQQFVDAKDETTGETAQASFTVRKYACTNTIHNPVSADIQLLGVQIQAALMNNANTDIYLVGHSLGGVVAYGYLAALTETTGIVTPLPSGAHLRGVITLDSPLGGISSNGKYFSNALAYFEATCKGFIPQLPTAVLNLSRIFDSTSKSTPPDSSEPDPQGAQASILSVPFLKVKIPTPFPSNQQVAEDAQVSGTSVLTIGNDHDLLWKPSVCFPKMQDFSSTQWLEDEGNNSNIYGRAFTSGGLHCFLDGALNTANHFDVFTDSSVTQGIQDFLPDGGTPTSPSVALPGPDQL